MKKLLLFIARLLIAACTIRAAGADNTWLVEDGSAAPAAVASGSGGRVLISEEGGLAIPASRQLASEMTAGFGGEMQVGYAFSRSFFLSLESGFDDLPLNNSYLSAGVTGGLWHIPLEAVAQVNLNAGGGVWPYLQLGAGLAFDSLAVTYAPPPGTPTNWTNFELDPGLGLAVDALEGLQIFAQAKVEMDFETVSGENAEFADKPLVIVPVQMGFNLLL